MNDAAIGRARTGRDFMGQPRRLHALTLLLDVVKLGPRSLNLIPAIAALGVTGQARWIAPAILLYALVHLVFGWLAWSRFSWTVDADDVSISSGILNRQQRVIPFDRIQDVSIEQGLLHRALGLAKVAFETGSSGGDDNEARLDAIALAEAEALRRHIRAHRAAAPASPAASDAPAEAMPAATPDVEGRVIFAMDAKRLVLAGLFNFSLAIFAVIGGLLSQVDNFLPFDPWNIDLYRDIAASLGLEAWVNAHRWISIVGGLMAVLLLGALTGIVRTVLRDAGFRLDRTERGLRRRRGLTTKTDVTLPVARVQAAILSTGPLRRRLGWFELHLQSLAGDGAGEKAHQVAPFARLTETDTILGELAIDRAGLEEGATTGWHRSHFAHALVTPAILAAAAAMIVLVAGLLPADIRAGIDTRVDLRWIAIFPGASAAFMLLLGWLDWRGRRWHFDGRLLHIADGFLSRSHIMLPARNIQSVDIAIGPLSRRLSLATLVLGVPGGGADQHRIAAIALDDARALRHALLAAR